MDLPDVAIGVIAAAVIAGAIALTTLIGGKENKTSEFRQAWIDGLRAEVSKFMSHAVALEGMIGSDYNNRAEIWKSAREDAAGLVDCGSRIRMRLNPEEDASKRILAILGEVEKMLGFDGGAAESTLSAPREGAIAEANGRLVNEVNGVLRKDWARVKAGEPKYQSVVWGAAGLLAVGLILSFAAVLSRGTSTPASEPVETGGIHIDIDTASDRREIGGKAGNAAVEEISNQQ